MQDGKNLIMAIVLCLLVVVGWSYLADYMGWVVKPDPAEIAKMEAAQAEQAQKAQAEAEAKQKAQAEPLPAFTPAPGVDVTVDAPLYKAVLHSGGGVLRSFELKKYTSGLDEDSPRINMVDPQTAAVAPLGLVINGQPSWSTGKWALESDSGVTVAEGGKGVVRLVGEVDNLRVTRELTFNSENYLISEKVSLATLGTDTRSVRVRYTVAADTSNAANTNYDAMRVAWDNGGSLGEETSTDKLTKEGVEASGKLYWAGPMSTYFLSAVMPGDADEARPRKWWWPPARRPPSKFPTGWVPRSARCWPPCPTSWPSAWTWACSASSPRACCGCWNSSSSTPTTGAFPSSC